MPDDANEDTLKVMENIAKLAQRERAKKREKEAKATRREVAVYQWIDACPEAYTGGH